MKRHEATSAYQHAGIIEEGFFHVLCKQCYWKNSSMQLQDGKGEAFGLVEGASWKFQPRFGSVLYGWKQDLCFPLR